MAVDESVNAGEGGQAKLNEAIGGASETYGSTIKGVKRELITPREVMQLGSDVALIHEAGEPVLRAGKAFWVRRPDMIPYVADSKY